MNIVKNGKVNFGLFDTPVEINLQDYDLKSPFGKKIRGFKNRLNQFHFTGISGKRFMIGIAVVDLKLISNGFIHIYDRKKNISYESSKIFFPSKKSRFIKTDPENTFSKFKFGKLNIEIEGKNILAESSNIKIDLKLRASQNPVRLCSRTGYSGLTYTQKELPLKIDKGELIIGSDQYNLSSPDHMAISDWTCGYMRRNTFWNWACAVSTLSCGRIFGLNLSCGVNETGYTENAFWIDNKMTKIDTVDFRFDEIDSEWQIKSFDGKVKLTFIPEHTRKQKTKAVIFNSVFSQLSGIFKGFVIDDSGDKVLIDDCPGWTEDHYAKW
ncbi:MAG: DUF2804 domain-containing protein [Deltaproteobacteria bacterium]|nr:DUF2804 domain-containing protein [Deltaproteobacteria bacterium]